MAAPRVALVVGSTGIVGSALVELLIERGWQVRGVSRHAGPSGGALLHIPVDLTSAADTAAALSSAARDATHVFFTTWSRQKSEAENIRVNGGMVRNVLAALPVNPAHVSLVTGLKHYLGPFEAYAAAGGLETPLRETMARVAAPNFYYAQEDALLEFAEKRGVCWHVHRPHTVIGLGLGHAMNMGVTLATYASLCKRAGRPFTFPGSPMQWRCLTDMTDARQLAAHVLWATETPAAANAALNIVNGDVFRWSWMWAEIAEYFCVATGTPPAEGVPPLPLESQMAGDAPAWRELAAEHGLVEPDLFRLASPWHTDADLGRPVEVVTDMGRSRALGFTGYVDSRAAFFRLFDALRAARVIPPA